MADPRDPFGDLPPPPKKSAGPVPADSGPPKGCLQAIGLALTIGVIGLLGGAAVLFVGAYVVCMHH